MSHPPQPVARHLIAEVDYSDGFAAISRSGISLTYEEIQEHGRRLDQLRPGQWFATITANITFTAVEVVTGRIIYPGVGSCLVELDRVGKSEDNRMRWAPECKVLPIPAPEIAKFLPMLDSEVEDYTKQIEEREMSTSQQATALRKRYKFYQDKLAAAGDEKTVVTCTDALTRIEEEAKTAGVDLNAPEGVTSVTTVSAGGTTTVAPGQKVKKTKKGSVAGAQAVEDKKTALAAEAGQKVPGATRVKKAPVLRPCLEGCGTMVGGNFKMGHDAKLKSLILKIERGEEEPSAIPEIAQDLVKFKRGEVEVLKDSKGVTTGKVQLWVCTAAPVRFKGRETTMVFTERSA